MRSVLLPSKNENAWLEADRHERYTLAFTAIAFLGVVGAGIGLLIYGLTLV